VNAGNYGENTDTLATCNGYCFFMEIKLIESVLMSCDVYGA